ncbi:MAG: hypothetical protein MZV63_05220 [Marinilabiliales bacterium]|nr:hypothetical protein [Marinilabiliales bacterium]
MGEAVHCIYEEGVSCRGEDFFLRQLNLVGSAAAAEALAGFVNDSVSCDDAVIALQFIGGDEAVMIMASGLASDVSPCAAQIMVALADMKYKGGVKDYIRWYEKGSQAEKSAALYALASAAESGCTACADRGIRKRRLYVGAYGCSAGFAAVCKKHRARRRCERDGENHR